jgi:hypothetical protein
MNVLTHDDWRILRGVLGPVEIRDTDILVLFGFPRLLHHLSEVHAAMKYFAEFFEEKDADGKIRKVLEPYVRSLYSRVIDSEGCSTIARGVISDYDKRFNSSGELEVFINQIDLVTLVCELKRNALNYCAMLISCMVFEKLGKRIDSDEDFDHVSDLFDDFRHIIDIDVLRGLVDEIMNMHPGSRDRVALSHVIE